MRRLLPLLLFCAPGLAACGDGPGGSPICRPTIAAPSGYDLVLSGSGGCPGEAWLRLRVATGDPAAPTWSDAASAPLRVEGTWAEEGGAFLRPLRVTNPGSAPVRLVGLEWASEAGRFTVPVDRMLHDGYQSWSYTGIEPVPASIPEEGGTFAHGGDNEDLTGEVAGVSWWWTFASDASGRGLVAGADGGTVLKTTLAFDRAGDPEAPGARRFRIVQGATGDGLLLPAGGSRDLDGLFLFLGEVGEGLERYAAAVRPAAGRSTAEVGPRKGWGSWNVYYADVTAALLREEAAWAKERLVPLGLTDFLLDDGYEPHWGVWEAKPAFGADLATLNAEQAALGLKPAVWLAPFYLDVTDPMVAAHPDRFVHKRDGTLRTYNNFGPSYAAFDVTHPDARAYVVDAVKRLRSFGYRTLKIDFLFGGAIEGVRREDVTALESYALWMEALREAAPDLHVVGCGAPMLPSVGRVDSMRIGADVGIFPSKPAPTYPFIASAARQTILRGFTDSFWALDPDVVLLRGDGIDDAEAFATIVAGALSGGNYLLGDGRQASALRAAMALDPAILALAGDGRAARPVDVAERTDNRLFISPLIDVSGETDFPHVWKKRGAQGEWVAVFGWGDGPTRVTLDLPERTVEVLPPVSPTTPSTTAPFTGKRTIEVPRHGVRLFRTPAVR